MARVEYIPIKPGDLRDIKDINGIFDAIAAETANVTRQNLAEEGIDDSAMVLNVQGRKAFVPVKVTIAGVVTPGVVLAPLVIGAVTVAVVGPIVLATNERLRVVFRAQYVSDAGNRGIPAGETARIQLEFDSPAPLVLPATERRESPETLGLDKCVSTMHVIDGPLTVDRIEVLTAITGGASFQMNHATLYGYIFQRVN